MHSWSGPHGVPGGTERWEHGSYRWRRGLEAVALVTALALLAPWTLEVVAGAVLIALGLLWLVWRARRRRQHRGTGLLALLLAIIALVEARKQPR